VVKPDAGEKATVTHKRIEAIFMKLFELKENLQSRLADARQAAAKGDDREYGQQMGFVSNLQREIAALEANNSIRGMVKDGVVLSDARPTGRRALSPAYAKALHHFIASRGQEMMPELADGADGFGGFRIDGKMMGALYEGSETAGGYAVPVVVDDQIVPLAPQELAVRKVAMVIPTTMDIKVPTKTAFSTAAAKAETSSFTESEPTISQFTLSAYMAGVLQEISWELAQDVPAFQAFAVDDMLLAQAMYEENLYVNGTGSGQAQGLTGNVGVGYGPQEADTNGNLVTIAGILNTIGTLNETYHPNASFLMQRATSIVLRKAQMESNLFFPAFSRVGGQDYLFGYPVNYSAYMPAATRGNSPVIFGDFKRGYIIGDRGGSGINVKVLDQPLASQGLIQLLAYRRTDGRVRRSEALQSYEISAS
jgi:HK97 family phage major capsid protein